MITYTPDVAGRKRFIEENRDNLFKKSKQKSEEWGILTIKLARVICPFKKGRLKRSLWRGAKENIFLFHRSKGIYTVEVGSKVPYVGIIENGIHKSYPIPKGGTMPKGKYLKFIGRDGRIHFSKGVIHPRVKGLFFLRTSAINAEKMVFK